jgi:hypothetical protein
VAYLFKKASCVVVGTFNIFILHPQWLAKQGLIEKGTGVFMETNLAEPGFRFRMAKDRVTWNIAPHKIAVETEDPTVDCGAKIASVLEKLPETPLFALGNNVVYRADLAEKGTLAESIRDFPWIESPSTGDTVIQRTFHVGVKHDQHRSMSIQVSIKEDEIELVGNAHTELRDRDTLSEVIPAAQRFFADREDLETSLRHFFGTGIKYASSDD